jgi:hypothetical protein
MVGKAEPRSPIAGVEAPLTLDVAPPRPLDLRDQ